MPPPHAAGAEPPPAYYRAKLDKSNCAKRIPFKPKLTVSEPVDSRKRTAAKMGLMEGDPGWARFRWEEEMQAPEKRAANERQNLKNHLASERIHNTMLKNELATAREQLVTQQFRRADNESQSTDKIEELHRRVAGEAHHSAWCRSYISQLENQLEDHRIEMAKHNVPLPEMQKPVACEPFRYTRVKTERTED